MQHNNKKFRAYKNAWYPTFLFTMYFVSITRFVEPVTIEVTVTNPLKVTLVLREIELLWRFVPDEDDNAQTKFFSNEAEFGKVIISIDY